MVNLRVPSKSGQFKGTIQKFVYKSQKTNPKISTDIRSKNYAEDGTLKQKWW